MKLIAQWMFTMKTIVKQMRHTHSQTASARDFDA